MALPRINPDLLLAAQLPMVIFWLPLLFLWTLLPICHLSFLPFMLGTYISFPCRLPTECLSFSVGGTVILVKIFFCGSWKSPSILLYNFLEVWSSVSPFRCDCFVSLLHAGWSDLGLSCAKVVYSLSMSLKTFLTARILSNFMIQHLDVSSYSTV
jgi:hypothetical protein